MQFNQEKNILSFQRFFAACRHFISLTKPFSDVTKYYPFHKRACSDTGEDSVTQLLVLVDLRNTSVLTYGYYYSHLTRLPY